MTADESDQLEASSHSSTGVEPLACVSCRSRKLKCDRTRPACTRCTKVGGECVYPESRRKPTFKRRNVKELEARLAQVEDYLKEATKGGAEGTEDVQAGVAAATHSDSSPYIADFAFDSASARQETDGETLADHAPKVAQQDSGVFNSNNQLIGLGFSGSLPPFEVMEELNTTFFNTQYHYIPVVHSGRYYQAFYGGPLMKPPMCLQYAIWAMASVDHGKYEPLSDVFYQRAHQYAAADEMRDEGEHFITISHAQTWAILASYEARRMLFTRAAISSAKCVRLVHMMGLHRLDGGADHLPPALGPTTSWIEVEERRRVFWGAFTIDCHASMSTGWPNMMNSKDIMTRLPATEDAFASGREEETAFLDEVFTGAPYAGFSGVIMACEIFKKILQHVHRIKPDENTGDQMQGDFWKRHRDIDNQLSSVFIFLPDKFRLPQNLKDPAAVHCNLNLHVATISLHHAALEMAVKYELADVTKATHLTRLKTSAEEISNIIKMTSHSTNIFRSPLSALSLYCAASVYIYVAKEDPNRTLNPVDKSNLELMIHCMEAVSRLHKITRSFLLQVRLDIEQNGLSGTVRFPNVSRQPAFSGFHSNIPLLARSSVTSHTKIASVLPGKLPLDKRPPRDAEITMGIFGEEHRQPRGMIRDECFQALIGAATRNLSYTPNNEQFGQKRKRVSASPGPEMMFKQSSGVIPRSGDIVEDRSGVFEMRDPARSSPTNASVMDSWKQGGMKMPAQVPESFMVLPDRTSSSVSSPAERGAWAETLSPSTDTSAGGFGLGNTAEENRIDLRMLQGRVAAPLWPEADDALLAQFDSSMLDAAGMPGDGSDPWGLLNTDMSWNNNPAPG